jgi:hypothetical protein
MVVITSALLMMSVTVAILSLVDLALSDAQKKRISDQVIRLWNWLDDMKQLSFLNWLRARPAQRLFIIAASLISVQSVSPFFIEAFLVDLPPDEFWNSIITLIILLLGTAFGLWIGPIIVSYLLQSNASIQFLWRSFKLLLLVIMPDAVLLIFAVSSFAEYDVSSLSYFALLLHPLSVSLLAFWAIAFIPLVIVYIISAVLWVSEFIMRRVAENPKGPVLAISALFTAILAIFKALGYA